jgi:chromosome segregation ATPase
MFNLFPKKKSVDEHLESNEALYASIKKEASDLASGVVNGVYEIIALKNELQHQLDENAKLMKEIKDLKGMQKGYIHERDTAREVNAKLLKEKEELEAQLKSIEEDGTEEHNAAVKLRQENAKLKDEIAKWEKDWDEQNKVIIDLNERVNEIDSDQNEKYRAEILTLKNDIAVLKNRNTELLEKYNGFVTMGGLKYMEAKLQIVQNNYKKCTEQRDEFKHQLNAANKEIEALKKEKKESFEILKKAIEDESARFYKLVVEDTNNWINLKAANKEIEALKSKVRDWEDKYAKSFSYRDMDKLQKTIDEQKKEIQKLKGNIVDYVIEKDDKLEEAKAIIEALKGMKTQGFEDYDPSDFILQKHPMYPLHWGILQKAKDLTEGVEVDLNKSLDEQSDKDIAFTPWVEEPIDWKGLPKSFPNEFQDDKTTADNLEERFDEGKDILDYFKKPWKCKDVKAEKSWEEVASDLALRVIKLEKQIEELKIVNTTNPYSAMKPDGTLKAINCKGHIPTNGYVPSNQDEF